MSASFIEQGTEEWMALRLGKVTASRIADLTATTRSGYGASRANYMAELICQRLTGVRQETYTNAAMQHGIDTEPEARTCYEFLRDAEVELASFVPHPSIEMAGASPDGYVGDDGLIEIKCPSTNTHIDTLLGSAIDGKYIKQIQWQLCCTERSWADFVSFDNRLPPKLQIHIQRVHRDDKLILELETEVVKFLAELEAKLEALENLA